MPLAPRRSDDTLLSLITDTALQDPIIRAVILSGSRVNSKIEPDPLQDFDIIYVVNELAPYQNNLNWIQRFGELMILQMPDQMFNSQISPWKFTYLMQFTDGHRLDLNLYELSYLNHIKLESLSQILIDKDDLFSTLPQPSDSDYWPTAPNPQNYFDTCNEFWWVSPYVAKGLWRQEVIYAKQMLEDILRTQTLRMLIWEVGIRLGYDFNPGYQGKFLQTYLTPDRWQELLQSYANADMDSNWQALFVICQLFRKSAQAVAEHFGFDYLSEQDQKVSAYLDYLYQHQGKALYT